VEGRGDKNTEEEEKRIKGRLLTKLSRTGFSYAEITEGGGTVSEGGEN